MSDVTTKSMRQSKIILQILRSGKALAPYIAETVRIEDLTQKIAPLRKKIESDIGKYRVRDPDGKITSAYFIEIPGVVTEELIKAGEADPPPLYNPEEDLVEQDDPVVAAAAEAIEEESDMEPEHEPEVVERELAEDEEDEDNEDGEEEPEPTFVEEIEADEPEDWRPTEEPEIGPEETEPDRVEDEVAELAEADAVADTVEAMEARVRAEQRDVVVDVLVDDMKREIEGLKNRIEELTALAAEPAGRQAEETVRSVDEISLRVTKHSGVVLEVLDEGDERRLYALSEKQWQFLARWR